MVLGKYFIISMFQLFCYVIYVHVKIINFNWNMELNLRKRATIRVEWDALG
jgi:hypothetical protein